MDIELRHAITRGEAWSELTGKRGNGAGNEQEDATTCNEEAGKMVDKLRQVVQKSRWEAIAGSPKFVNARFSVSKYLEEKTALDEKERLDRERRDERQGRAPSRWL